MVDSLIIHVGTHKTGSTALQAFLSGSSEELLDNGVLYPKAGRGSHPGHANLVWERNGSIKWEPNSGGHKELISEIGSLRPQKVILSSEGFSEPENSEAFADWAREVQQQIGAKDVTVVAYVRPQWDYAESLYSQQIKGGRTSATFSEVIRRGDYENRFNYLDIFMPWGQKFNGRVIARPFREDKLIKNDVVADFCTTISLRRPVRPETGRRNRRVGERRIEMTRSLRELLDTYKLTDMVPVTSAFDQIGKRIEAAFPEDDEFVGLTPELVEDIERRVRSHNEEFLRRFMRPEDGDLFDSRLCRTRSEPPWTLSSATKEERMVFGELVAATISWFKYRGG